MPAQQTAWYYPPGPATGPSPARARHEDALRSLPYALRNLRAEKEGTKVLYSKKDECLKTAEDQQCASATVIAIDGT